ncbi:MAG TPA: gamma-glutamyl-gamma-aminobutyrate hydrolase family protein [Candidatus Binatia bacterium]
MKKVLVFQHVPHEDLGTLNNLLRLAGFEIHTMKFWSAGAPANLEGFAALIVLGGPMGVYEADKYSYLTAETELIETAVKNDLPLLGICLGSQLIANALGARVYPSGIKEIGWYDLTPTADAGNDPLLRHLNATEKVFQWHGDTFDLPNGAIHLASSPLCPNQAFRYGRNAYALQFHLEVDSKMIDTWLDVLQNRDEIAGLHGEFDPTIIRDETTRHIGRLENLSRLVFGDFIRLLEKSAR